MQRDEIRMTSIDIFKPDGTLWNNVVVTEAAKHTQELMKTDEIELSFKANASVLIPMGAYVVHPTSGARYYLAEPYYSRAKNGIYTYTPVFKHELMLLAKIPFLFYSTDSEGVTTVESDWNFTGKGADLMTSLSEAIYQGIGVRYAIQIDSSLTKALELQFVDVDILSALNQIAEQWEAEWYTDEQTSGVLSDNRVIHFAPRCVHYGGNGTSRFILKAGDNVDYPSSNEKSEFYNRFFVFGSTRNIPQDYQGAMANHVVNKRLTLDPAKYPDGYIDLPDFDDDGNARYKQDEVTLESAVQEGDRIFTKVLTFEDIYPHSNCRVKTVHSYQRFLTDENDNGNKVQLADGTYASWYLYVITLEYQDTDGTWKPFTLNKSTYDKDTNPTGSLIKGLTLSIHFKGGALEGREFEMTYNETAREYRAEYGGERTTEPAGSFELKYTQDNTIIIPNDNMPPAGSDDHTGDEVIVFNIRMPQSYYNIAYEELEAKAIEQIWEITRDSNQYTVKSNPVKFATQQPHLTLGRRILLKTGGRDIDTRVMALSTHLDRPIEQDITLSKNLTKGVINTLRTTIESTAQKVSMVSVKDDTAVKLTKQAMYRSLQEMHDSMFDNDGNFTAPISPLSVQTAVLSVGATSTNFNLIDIYFQPNYQGDYNQFYIAASASGKMVHYGIDPTAATPREWNMTGGTINIADLTPVSGGSRDGVWYLYAQCSQSGTGGTFFLSQEQKRFNSDSTGTWYWFLVGVLSSKYQSSTNEEEYMRVFNSSFGQTAIDGRFVTTGCIQSASQEVGIDLDNGEIWGKINFSHARNASTKSQIEAMANSAATSAASTAETNAKTYADEQISNIQIGGRNLFGKFNLINPTKATDNTNVYFAMDNNGVVTKVSGAERHWTYANCQHRTLEKLPAGTYTVSVWIVTPTTHSNPNVRLCITEDGETVRYQWLTWKTKSTTFTLDNDAYVGVIAKCYEGSYRIKLEKGNIATDWTPAPEDETQALTNLATTIASDIDNLQNQIDGQIMTWFYAYDPSLSNAPASDWNTTDLKNNHLGDLFYNTDSGHCYRFALEGGTYKWLLIKDEDISTALANAATAQAAADSKMRVFTTTPTPPYDLGDMWVQGANGDIKYCSTAKASGASYSASDWVNASKYTDDTVANQAATAAATAQTTANNAATAAAAAKTRLDNIANDKIVSPSEKPALKQQQNDINSEYASNISEANKYGVSTTAYATAKTNVDTAFALFLASATWGDDISIASGTANATKYGYIAAYYTARQTLLDAIATAAKTYADTTAAAAVANIQIGGRNLLRDTKAFGRSGVASSETGYLIDYGTLDSSTYNGLAVRTVAASSATPFGNWQVLDTKPNEEYTLSFWAKGDAKPRCYFYQGTDVVKITTANGTGTSSDGNSDSAGGITISADTWTRVWVTWKLAATAGDSSTKRCLIRNDNKGTIYVCGAKLERGNKPTEWTPAPEDIDTDIAAAQSAADSANASITSMNGDTTFSIIEKKAFRPEWKAISGYDNTTSTPTTSTNVGGSYEKALKAVGTTGVSTSALTTAFSTLRTYLNTNALWTNSNTTGFSQSTLGTYVKNYYDAETALYNALADYYAQQVATDQGNRNILRNSRSFNLESSSNWANGTWRTGGSGTGTRTRIRPSDNGYPTNVPAQTDVWQISGTASSGETSICQQYITDMEAGQAYTLSCYARATSGTPKLYLQSGNGAYGGQTSQTVVTTEWQQYKLTVTNTAAQMSSAGGGIIFFGHYSSEGVMQICGVKLERGSRATKWNPNDADVDYLSEALTAATKSPGSVDGGLMLGSFIAVQDASNNIQAGMCGQLNSNLPMLFAGRINDTNYKFEVNGNSGVITSKSNDQSLKCEIDESALIFAKKNSSGVYELRNIITSEVAASISAMLTKANMSSSSGTLAAQTSTTRNYGQTVYKYFTNQQVSSPIQPTNQSSNNSDIVKTIIAASAITKETSVSYQSFTITFNITNNTYGTSTSSYTLSDWFTVREGSCSGYYTVKLNNNVLVAKTAISSTKTITIPAGSITLQAGTALVLTVTFQMSFGEGYAIEKYYGGSESAYLDDNGDYKIELPFSRSASFYCETSAISYVTGQSQYCNNFYSNGFMLAESTYKYFGVHPQMGSDGTGSIFEVSAGTAAASYNRFKMNTNGLLFSAGSSSFWQLNPLCLIVKIVYSSSSNYYGASALYNPRGVDINSSSAVRNSAGNITLTHNLSKANLVLQIQHMLGADGNAKNARSFSCYIKSKNAINIYISQGDSSYDLKTNGDYFLVFIYDYSN